MKKTFLLLSFLVCMVSAVQAQVYNQMDPSGNITQRDEYGNNSKPSTQTGATPHTKTRKCPSDSGSGR